jgi:hypothetical protein
METMLTFVLITLEKTQCAMEMAPEPVHVFVSGGWRYKSECANSEI